MTFFTTPEGDIAAMELMNYRDSIKTDKMMFRRREELNERMMNYDLMNVMHGISKDSKSRVFIDLIVAASRLSHTNLTISSADVQKVEIDNLLRRYRELKSLLSGISEATKALDFKASKKDKDLASGRKKDKDKKKKKDKRTGSKGGTRSRTKSELPDGTVSPSNRSIGRGEDNQDGGSLSLPPVAEVKQTLENASPMNMELEDGSKKIY